MDSYYSDRGELMYVRGSSKDVKGHDRYLVSSRDNQIIYRQDGTKRQAYFYANGNSVGNVGNLEGSWKTDFDVNFTPATATQQSDNATYPVQDGDSLKGIAHKIWDEESLWYMLADANRYHQR